MTEQPRERPAEEPGEPPVERPAEPEDATGPPRSIQGEEMDADVPEQTAEPEEDGTTSGRTEDLDDDYLAEDGYTPGTAERPLD
ncbi:hypothetical protein [Actinomadura miaoliensis]|uniref:DUF5709 domain-containing protein n=1 Tax=Actinomadura miaoliensis TaxID=430685 RepID=A0ABP7W3C7_9ACTN